MNRLIGFCFGATAFISFFGASIAFSEGGADLISAAVPEDALIKSNIESLCFGQIGAIVEFLGVNVGAANTHEAFFLVNFSSGVSLERSLLYHLSNDRWIVDCFPRSGRSPKLGVMGDL